MNSLHKCFLLVPPNIHGVVNDATLTKKEGGIDALWSADGSTSPKFDTADPINNPVPASAPTREMEDKVFPFFTSTMHSGHAVRDAFRFLPVTFFISPFSPIRKKMELTG